MGKNEWILWFISQVFEGLHSQGQQAEVRDWVLLSLGSFIQRFVIFLFIITGLSGMSSNGVPHFGELLLLFFKMAHSEKVFLHHFEGIPTDWDITSPIPFAN